MKKQRKKKIATITIKPTEKIKRTMKTLATLPLTLPLMTAIFFTALLCDLGKRAAKQAKNQKKPNRKQRKHTKKLKTR